MAKSSSAEEVKLRTHFDSLRETLKQPEFTERLEKPLAFWVVPTDRRLPLAFLPLPLRELLGKSYSELANFPGIGSKKMQTLVKLLNRALNLAPAESIPEAEPIPANGSPALAEGQFDVSNVSELVWSKWRNSVHARGLGYEKVGRLCSALHDVPTVIWHTPLAFYLQLKLEDIRALKTHGEKRVRVVLEVFHAIHQMHTTVESLGGLAVRPAPKFTIEVENSLAAFRGRGLTPTRLELEVALVEPILRQLLLDCGETIHNIASDRLGINQPNGVPVSVRLQARKLGVTRARIYQLLEECSAVMQVRWPEGRRQLDDFAQWLDQIYAPAESANMLAALRELLFPLKYDAVGEHLLKDSLEEETAAR